MGCNREGRCTCQEGQVGTHGNLCGIIGGDFQTT